MLRHELCAASYLMPNAISPLRTDRQLFSWPSGRLSSDMILFGCIVISLVGPKRVLRALLLTYMYRGRELWHLSTSTSSQWCRLLKVQGHILVSSLPSQYLEGSIVAVRLLELN